MRFYKYLSRLFLNLKSHAHNSYRPLKQISDQKKSRSTEKNEWRSINSKCTTARLHIYIYMYIYNACIRDTYDLCFCLCLLFSCFRLSVDPYGAIFFFFDFLLDFFGFIFRAFLRGRLPLNECNFATIKLTSLVMVLTQNQSFHTHSKVLVV